MTDKLLKIIKHYGITNQLKKLHEEVYELTEAILTDASSDHITEEIADVHVLMGQIKAYFDVDDYEFVEWFDYKVDRQLKRIEAESEKPSGDIIKLKAGDTIKCADSHECVGLMMDFARAGIQTDFIYEKDGQKGLWLVITEVEDGTN